MHQLSISVAELPGASQEYVHAASRGTSGGIVVVVGRLLASGRRNAKFAGWLEG
jgi:hypothetical protein